MDTSKLGPTNSPYADVLRGRHEFLVRLNTFSRSLPRTPDSSALRTLCSTTGQRLHRGLLRQHFFFGLSPANLLDFTEFLAAFPSFSRLDTCAATITYVESRPNFRNVAIVAHVDHGKTTLVDAMLRQ